MVRSNSYSKSVNKHCPLYLYLKCLPLIFHIRSMAQVEYTLMIHYLCLLDYIKLIMIYLNQLASYLYSFTLAQLYQKILEQLYAQMQDATKLPSVKLQERSLLLNHPLLPLSVFCYHLQNSMKWQLPSPLAVYVKVTLHLPSTQLYLRTPINF